MFILSKIKKYILDLIFPIKCFVCKKQGDAYICLDCVKKVAIGRAINSCLFCEKGSIGGRTCARCLKKNFLDGCVSIASYADSTIHNLIKLYKYEEMDNLAPCFKYLVERFFREFKPAFLFSDNAVIIPIPLYPRKEKSRGFNQAKIIAGFTREMIGFEVVDNVLKRVKNKKAQAKIKNNKARGENIKGVFACCDADLIIGKTIILVDDVATSGATLNECARVLKESGAKEAWGFTIARG